MVEMSKVSWSKLINDKDQKQYLLKIIKECKNYFSTEKSQNLSFFITVFVVVIYEII